MDRYICGAGECKEVEMVYAKINQIQAVVKRKLY
jgi:hypothetical protein